MSMPATAGGHRFGGKKPAALSTVQDDRASLALSTVKAVQAHAALSTVAPSAASLALSTVSADPKGKVDPRILLLERQRRAVNISHGELCRRARVAPTTWFRLRTGERPARPSTVVRLKRAIASDKVVAPMPLLAALHRMAMTVIATELNENVARLMAQDFSVERPTSAEWLRASEVRRFAIALVLDIVDVRGAELGHALGLTRQAVHKALRFVDNARAGDEKLDALITRLAASLRGPQ